MSVVQVYKNQCMSAAAAGAAAADLNRLGLFCIELDRPIKTRRKNKA
jgi:hypothetical protein